MRTIEPARWDDYVLAGLVMVVAVPRLVLAILHDRPFGVEGTLSLVLVVLAAAIVVRRWR